MIKIIIILFSLFAISAHTAQIFRTGNPKDIKNVGEFGACLAGGGDDNEWSDGWKYLLSKALNWNNNGKAVRAYIIAGKKNSQTSFDMKTWTGTGGHDQFWYVDGSSSSNPQFKIKEE